MERRRGPHWLVHSASVHHLRNRKNTFLTTLDPIAATKAGDANSAAAFVASAKVIDTADAIASAFGATDFGKTFTDAFAALDSDANGLTTGQSLDLSDQGTVAALIMSALARKQMVCGEKPSRRWARVGQVKQRRSNAYPAARLRKEPLNNWKGLRLQARVAPTPGEVRGSNPLSSAR
jgi:hypothetical protein